MKPRTLLSGAALYLLLVLSSPRAEAALDAYLRLKGQKQGEIKGSVTLKGVEGRIRVIAMTQQLFSPLDPTTGLPTGKRRHTPVVVTVEWDQATPQLRSAFINAENIPEWELLLLQPASGGTSRPVMSIRLTNARITGINTTMFNIRAPEYANYPIMDEIAFVYQKISWTWLESGVTVEDDWNSPAP